MTATPLHFRILKKATKNKSAEEQTHFGNTDKRKMCLDISSNLKQSLTLEGIRKIINPFKKCIGKQSKK